MHFITGGAYNGKTKWAKQFYGLNEQCLWLSGYQNNSTDLGDYKGNIAVMQGLEAWIEQDVNSMDVESIRNKWKGIMERWRIWEQEDARRLCIVIGSDITKGIVPLEQQNRKWRDASGWVFQDVARISTRVDIIWYGISQQIK